MSLARNWRDIKFGKDGVGIAIAANTNLAVRFNEDGTTSQVNLGQSLNWLSIATNGNGTWVVMGGSANNVFSTDNGITFQPLNIGGADNAVVWTGSRFIAYSTILGGTGIHSVNGISWTGLIGTLTRLPLLAAGNDVAVAVLNSTNYPFGRLSGNHWSQITGSSSGVEAPGNSNQSIAYGKGVFINTFSRGINNVRCRRSTDLGQSWQQGGELPNSAVWQALAFGKTAGGANVFIALGNSRYGARSLDDGLSWEEIDLELEQDYRALAFNGQDFIALANNSNVGLRTIAG
jgi:hypothetical protein